VGHPDESGCRLQKTSLLISSAVMPRLPAFGQTNILAPGRRDAALIGLGAPQKDLTSSTKSWCQAQLLMMYQDSSIEVSDAISWVIIKICAHHTGVLQQISNFATTPLQL